MYERFMVKPIKFLSKKEYISLVTKSKFPFEIKCCIMCLTEGFIKSKKYVNVDFTKNNNRYEGFAKKIMSVPCEKGYSKILFEVCKLIAKKFHYDYDIEYECDIEHSMDILSQTINNNYIYKLEKEVLIHNEYNMYRDISVEEIQTLFECCL